MPIDALAFHESTELPHGTTSRNGILERSPAIAPEILTTHTYVAHCTMIRMDAKCACGGRGRHLFVQAGEQRNGGKMGERVQGGAQETSRDHRQIEYALLRRRKPFHNLAPMHFSHILYKTLAFRYTHTLLICIYAGD